MTPIQKAKEITVAWFEYWRNNPDGPSVTWERWSKTDEGKQLLSGEDWKEDEKEPINIDFNTRVVVTDNKGRTRKYKLVEVDY